MTTIDFYISGANKDTVREQIACRLCEKACNTSLATFIHTQNKQHSEELDKLLWTYKQHSFLPHQLYDDDEANTRHHPILIGHNIEPEKNIDLLINLDNKVPSFFSRFNRVIEIVTNDEKQRDLSRKHYTFYKDRGYIINTHDI